MQISNSSYRSVMDCARHVHATEGLRAFYISYPTTLLMNIPLQAVQFSVYEILKSFLNPTGEYSPSTHIAAGGVAGGVAAALTTPLDVAKVSRGCGRVFALDADACPDDVAPCRPSCKPEERRRTHGYVTLEAWPRLSESLSLEMD